MKEPDMKCLGLIGGCAVEETTHYARQIDEEVRHRFGEQQSANLVALSLQTRKLATHMAKKDWPEAGKILSRAMAQLAALGAESVLLCSSALHVAATEIATEVPLLDIVDPVVTALRRAKRKRIGLVGPRSTEEEQWWRRRLARAHLHDVFFPVLRDRQYLAALLSDQLDRGIVTEHARADVVRIAYSLRQAGARALVVCAPELTALLEDAVPVLPIFDATELHALAAVDWMTAGMMQCSPGDAARRSA